MRVGALRGAPGEAVWAGGYFIIVGFFVVVVGMCGVLMQCDEMVVIRGRVIWLVIGKSGIFGRSLALHTKEFISKDGEESYIN